MLCRVCGCDEYHACATDRGGRLYVCFWAEPGLCSFCALSVDNAVTRIPVRGVEEIAVRGGVL